MFIFPFVCCPVIFHELPKMLRGKMLAHYFSSVLMKIYSAHSLALLFVATIFTPTHVLVEHIQWLCLYFQCPIANFLGPLPWNALGLFFFRLLKVWYGREKNNKISKKWLFDSFCYHSLHWYLHFIDFWEANRTKQNLRVLKTKEKDSEQENDKLSAIHWTREAK